MVYSSRKFDLVDFAFDGHQSAFVVMFLKVQSENIPSLNRKLFMICILAWTALAKTID